MVVGCVLATERALPVPEEPHRESLGWSRKCGLAGMGSLDVLRRNQVIGPVES